jgi:tetratricopeptide (TPR) repeat protein
MRLYLSFAVFAVVVVALLPARAFADPKTEAKQHREQAAAAFREKRFEDALDALNKAYALEPKAELHYAIGQIYVKLGRCPDAIIAYEQFLASKPARDRAATAREAIEVCKTNPPPAEVTTEPAPEPSPEPEPAPAPVVQAPPEPDVPHTITQATPTEEGAPPWYKDGLGIALVGGGTALAVAGVAVYVIARGNLADSEDAATYQEQVDLYDSARSKQMVSFVLVGAGVVATGLGVYHYVKRSGTERSVAFVPTSGGGLVTWSGRY